MKRNNGLVADVKTMLDAKQTLHFLITFSIGFRRMELHDLAQSFDKQLSDYCLLMRRCGYDTWRVNEILCGVIKRFKLGVESYRVMSTHK